jgi:hypothetical protein
MNIPEPAQAELKYFHRSAVNRFFMFGDNPA